MSEKADIESTDSPHVTEERFMQPLQLPIPRDLTCFPITSVDIEFVCKALSPIVVTMYLLPSYSTVSGIIILVLLSDEITRASFVSLSPE